MGNQSRVVPTVPQFCPRKLALESTPKQMNASDCFADPWLRETPPMSGVLYEKLCVFGECPHFDRRGITRPYLRAPFMHGWLLEGKAKKRAMLGGSTSEGYITGCDGGIWPMHVVWFHVCRAKALVLRRDMVTSFSLKAFPWRHAQESFVRPGGKGIWVLSSVLWVQKPKCWPPTKMRQPGVRHTA